MLTNLCQDPPCHNFHPVFFVRALVTIENGFPGFQSKLVSPLSMFHVGDAEGEPFLILTELPPQPGVCNAARAVPGFSVNTCSFFSFQ